MSMDQVRDMVAGWQTLAVRPMGSAISKTVSMVEPVCDEQGRALYYIVQLAPEGFVLAAPDDEIEPLIAFSSQGIFERDGRNPLSVLIEADMRGRLEALSKARARTANPSMDRNAFPSKWRRFYEAACPGAFSSRTRKDPDDLRVAPLTKTTWAQGAVGGKACFNYHTPPYGPGVSSNYPGGCTQTAWAQIMRFYRWPQASVSGLTRTIQVDGVAQEAVTRGGAYDWDLMPLAPDGDTPELQREAIGGLIYDLGVVNQASYAANGTAAGMSIADLVQVFGYSNAKHTSPDYAALSNLLTCAINANLDAGLVAQLSLTGGGSHAVVVDGYGYHAGAAMHHLNLGWGGNPDAWYQLPEVGEYNGLAGVVYNIYTNGTGEIVSGRTLDIDGNPMAGVEVRIAGGGVARTTDSDARGIYAFAQLPPHSVYTLSATGGVYRFPGRTVATAYSATHGAPGNRWGMDLVGLPPSHAYVSGVVTNRGGEAIAGVTIRIDGAEGAVTDERGNYLVWGRFESPVVVSAHKEGLGFEDAAQSVNMEAGGAVQVNFCGKQVFYVDANAGGTADGRSWPNAFPCLQEALAWVPEHSDIWVAKGVHKPKEGDRTNRFVVGTGVHLLGGFAGGEAAESERSPVENETVLSGDIGVVGDAADNAYAVLCASTHAWVDGFTIRDGNGGSTSGGGAGLASGAMLRNCWILDNIAGNGGGVSGGIVDHCVIMRNQAGYFGGGAVHSDLKNCLVVSNAAFSGGGAYGGTLTDCEIRGNMASAGRGVGGGAYYAGLNNCLVQGNDACYGGGAYACGLAHCTLVDNHAFSGGGASDATLDNCIVYYNRAYYNANNDAGTLRSCCVPSKTGGGNITNAPCFVRAEAGDYHLAAISPCIDAGSNQWVAALTDLDGNPRVVHDRTDMGAYEFQGVPTTYGEWAAAMGGGATNELDSAAGDGIPNLLRYAMGGDPVSAGEVTRLDVEKASTGMVLRFHRNIEARDLVLWVESSFSLSDGSAWQGLATNIGGAWMGSLQVREDVSGKPAVVTVRDSGAQEGVSSRYYRLRVRRP